MSMAIPRLEANLNLLQTSSQTEAWTEIMLINGASVKWKYLHFSLQIFTEVLQTNELQKEVKQERFYWQTEGSNM